MHCPSKPNADDPSSGSHHAANRIYHCLFYVNSFDAALPGKCSEFITYLPLSTRIEPIMHSLTTRMKILTILCYQKSYKLNFPILKLSLKKPYTFISIWTLEVLLINASFEKKYHLVLLVDKLQNQIYCQKWPKLFEFIKKFFMFPYSL